MNASTATADTPLRQAWSSTVEGTRPLRRDMIERGGPSKLGLAGRLALRDLKILFQVCLGLSGLRVPVSPGVLAVSSRTVMNNVGWRRREWSLSILIERAE